MNKLRTGILGCGDFAQRHVAIAMSQPERIELVAYCDRNREKAAATRERAGGAGEVYTRHEEMFARARLDLLVICLPPYGHTNEVELAAKHGVHFLIEKPIALDADTAWRMVAIAEAAALKTQVGFMNRFGAAVDQFRELQRTGVAGPTALLTGRYFCNALHAPWWRDRGKSGGQLLEQVIHLLDLSRYIMGNPVSVFCQQANLFHREVENYTSEDVSSVLIRFENGGMAAISSTNCAIPGKWLSQFSVVARHVTADFRSVNEATIVHTSQDPPTAVEINSSLDFRRAQWLDLVQAIDTSGTTRTPIREGACSLDLALAAVRSAAESREIRL